MLINEGEFLPGISEACILTRLGNFAQTNPLYRQNAFVLAEDDSFLQKCSGDPRYVSELIEFIENEFGVIVSRCEVSEENLGTLRAVARFVATKQPFAVG